MEIIEKKPDVSLAPSPRELRRSVTNLTEENDKLKEQVEELRNMLSECSFEMKKKVQEGITGRFATVQKSAETLLMEKK